MISAWLMGFIGSSHCIGMCGPLALAVPTASDSIVHKMYSGLLYNIGRISIYTLLGATIGLSQHFLIPPAFQQSVSVLMGIVLILIALSYIVIRQKRFQILYQHALYRNISKLLGKLYQQPRAGNIVLIGFLNGILPCGLVYAALATAFASMSFVKSIIFMAFFGLGTLPVMWGVVFFVNYITPAIRNKMKLLFPVVYLVAGILLMIRGTHDQSFLHDVMQHTIYCFK